MTKKEIRKALTAVHEKVLRTWDKGWLVRDIDASGNWQDWKKIAIDDHDMIDQLNHGYCD